MRTFGQVEPMLKVANRFKKTQTLRPKSTTPGATKCSTLELGGVTISNSIALIHPARTGASSPMSMSMDQAGPRSNTAMGEYDARTDQVRDPTTWTILQQNGPNHLGLWYNVLPEHQIALITHDCVPVGPHHLCRHQAGLMDTQGLQAPLALSASMPGGRGEP